MLTPRNNTFKFSGNSYLPAYPGFIVIKYATVGTKTTVVGPVSPGKENCFMFGVFLALFIDSTY